MLTDLEHQAVRQAADLWNTLVEVVGNDGGPTWQADLSELCAHVHAIQHAVMANAAARAHPELYRPLGGILHTVNGGSHDAAAGLDTPHRGQ